MPVFLLFTEVIRIIRVSKESIYPWVYGIEGSGGLKSALSMDAGKKSIIIYYGIKTKWVYGIEGSGGLSLLYPWMHERKALLFIMVPRQNGFMA